MSSVGEIDYESVEETDESDEDDTEELRSKVKHILSLKEICLECISDYFPRFTTAFSTSDDVNLQRNLTFLQRVYSSHFIKDLSRKGCLEEPYLDFLINEHLKELDISHLCRCSSNAIIERIAKVGHGFLKVWFSEGSMPPTWKADIADALNKIICHLLNVEFLHIPVNCNDETLKIIASSFPNLNQLNIDSSRDVTDEGLKMFCSKYSEAETKCSLKLLSLENTRVTESSIVCVLKNMPSLEVLRHENLPFILSSMHADDIKNNTLSTANKYNLTELNIFYFKPPGPITDILSVWTEVCPNIKTLSVTIEKESDMKLIARFSVLEDLTASFKSDSLSALDFNYVLKTNCSRLQKLYISDFALSIPVLIASCPKLESLSLSDTPLQSEADFSGNRLNSLRVLYMEGFDFSEQYEEAGVNSILKCSPNLEKIYFFFCDFKNCKMRTNLAKFWENCALELLNFNMCDVDLALLKAIILTCSSLKFLIISNCGSIDSNDAYNLIEIAKPTKCVVKFFTNLKIFNGQ